MGHGPLHSPASHPRRVGRRAEHAHADRGPGLSGLRPRLAADVGRRVGLRGSHRVLVGRDGDGVGAARRRPRPRDRPQPAERAADPPRPGAGVAHPVRRGGLPDGAGRGRPAAAGVGGRPDHLPGPERLAAARPRHRAGGGPAAGRDSRSGSHHRRPAQQAAGVRSVGFPRSVGGHPRRAVAEPAPARAAGFDDPRAEGGPLPHRGRELRIPHLDGRADPRRTERESPRRAHPRRPDAGGPTARRARRHHPRRRPAARPPPTTGPRRRVAGGPSRGPGAGPSRGYRPRTRRPRSSGRPEVRRARRRAAGRAPRQARRLRPPHRSLRPSLRVRRRRRSALPFVLTGGRQHGRVLDALSAKQPVARVSAAFERRCIPPAPGKRRLRLRPPPNHAHRQVCTVTGADCRLRCSSVADAPIGALLMPCQAGASALCRRPSGAVQRGVSPPGARGARHEVGRGFAVRGGIERGLIDR